MSNRHEGCIVFVVDDENIIASTIATILNAVSFKATPFTNPLEALRAARSGAPDVLVSDVRMPVMSGIELASRIKAFCPDCKIVLFSGQASVVDHFRNDSAPQERFEILQKPVHPAALLKRIQELLDAPSSASPQRLIDQDSAAKRPVQSVAPAHSLVKDNRARARRKA